MINITRMSCLLPHRAGLGRPRQVVAPIRQEPTTLDQSSPAGSCPTQSLPGPLRGREPFKIRCQQRTTTDNNPPGRPACWLHQLQI